MASKGTRFGARTLDAIAQLIVVIAVWIVFGDRYRLWTDVFLAFLVVWAYEVLFTLWLGATPAKRLLGLRVVELDRANPISAPACTKRGAMNAALTVLPVIGWTIWLVGTLGDTLGRGSADRMANTMVVPRAFAGPVLSRDLPGYADGVNPPRLSKFGRVADLDVRTRARLRRLTNSSVLVFAMAMLALAASVPIAGDDSTALAILVTSAIWIIVFIVDESRCVRRGATPGHELAGLVIVDSRTGAPPGSGRGFLRAVVLALTMYVPLLWPLLLISLLLMRLNESGRGLHDLAGRTMVITDPRLDPEAQRQRSMRMRLGLAG